VLGLPLVGGVIAAGVVKDGVVERLDADGEVVFVVHPLERSQQRVVDLSQITESGAGGAERRGG